MCVAALLMAGALFAQAARANYYDVVGCDAAPGGWAVHGWTASYGSGMTAYGSACPSNGEWSRGMVARNGVGAGFIPAGRAAAIRFQAPAGTTIAGLWASYSAGRNDDDYYLAWFKDASTVVSQSCAPNDGVFACVFGPGLGNSPAWIPVGSDNVRFEVGCGNPVGCSTASQGGGLGWRAHMNVYSTTVRLTDNSAPSVAATGGGLSAGSWLRGTQTVTYNTSDNSGVRNTQLFVDGQEKSDDGYVCDFRQPVPCSSLSGQSYSVATNTLADGAHTVQVRSWDAAWNAGNWTRTIYVDNNAPARVGVSVDGGSGWRTTNSFPLRWTNPSLGGGSPIVQAKYQLCPVGGSCGAVQTLALSGAEQNGGASVVEPITVPQPGEYGVKLWLRDAAGNEQSQLASDPVTLRFDDVVPGRAKLDIANGWLNAEEATAYPQGIELGISQTKPVSGIAGYSITTDGSTPDATIEAPGEQVSHSLTNLREGITLVRARSVSGAGVPSDQIDSTEIRVDRSPPAVSASGIPEASGWTRTAVTARIASSDQAGLSGVAAASADQPVESGGYIIHRVDGGQIARTRGSSAAVTVASDGRHSLAYQAFDVAGNKSAERVAEFKIDSTAPVAAFRARDPRDPRALQAIVFDATSGVAPGGVIELRPSGGSWERLPTTQSGGVLSTYLDDSRPAGSYELRVRVRDVAGNETISDRFEDGSVALLAFPLRLGTELLASSATEVKTSCRRVTRRVRVSSGRIIRRTFRVCRRMRVPSTRRGKKVTLRPKTSRRPVVTGLLRTVEGKPLSGTVVDVHEAPRTASHYRRVGSLRTDAAGRFRYAIPAGASRTIRFTYEGSPTVAPSQASIVVRSPAGSTIRVDRRRARNGQAVRFTGRLTGRPVPTAGKVVELQAKVGRRWVTFRTLRSKSTGIWRASYRFRSTTGVKTYQFRAFLRREADYPYEAGRSGVVRVTVRGR